MAGPTFSELYLAYRQAKTALYYERRGVGLIELARFEARLEDSLGALRPKLADDAWFDNLDIGEVWLVPKRLHSSAEGPDEVVRVGAAVAAAHSLDVQLRLSPNPEFAIAELLYLREFGPRLENVLSASTVGYRLDLRNDRLNAYRRWTFEYWPRRYAEFRSTPLKIARETLAQGDQPLLVISADLAAFYDSIDPSFLITDSFLAAVFPNDHVNAERYLHATRSLIGAYARFRKVASQRLGLAVHTGIPIGALSSRVVANVSLATLDQYVERQDDVLAYRRYVDDIVIVAKSPGKMTFDDAIKSVLPLGISDGEVLRLDATALERPGSDLQLQRRKIRVHELQGDPGEDFVKAVLADFDELVSRSKAFLDLTTLMRDGATHLIRASDGEGSPLRVLRDADRARLERFALSTSLQTLERASVLVDPEEAHKLVRRTLERVNRVMNAADDWVEGLDASFRLLRLAIGTDDWRSCAELNDHMDALFGTAETLRRRVGHLLYRGQPIDPDRSGAWAWLRNYLHARRLEACASAVRQDMTTSEFGRGFPRGIAVRSGIVRATALRRRACELAQADLRSFDREDDHAFAGSGLPGTWMEEHLADSAELLQRFARIGAFLETLAPADTAWRMPPAKLFLCTRPPSYFDVAHRLLHRTEAEGFDEEVFKNLLQVVNAIRGTEYEDPVGWVREQHTVHIAWAVGNDEAPSPAQDPRLVLGNLPVRESYWTGAARGRPVLDVRRLAGVVRMLDRAEHAARGASARQRPAPTLLVLPELSIPRQWFRPLATHIARHGGFGAVMGLEYARNGSQPEVVNQAFAVLPGPFGSVATWPWTKRRPAHGEGVELAKHGLSFAPLSNQTPRTVVETNWGRFSVLICSELLEARRVADLLGRAELILCPAWNPDTASYDHLIQTVGFQLHAVIAVANNGHYSDCRAWAPRVERWERDLCRLIERDIEDIVYVDLPLQSLIKFHRQVSVAPADDEQSQADRPDWRPLPPEWPASGDGR